MPARVARTRAGAPGARAPRGGGRGGAPRAEDRTRESAVLDHDRERRDAPDAPGGGARGLRAGGAAASRRRCACGCRSATCRRRSAGAPTARPPTRRRSQHGSRASPRPTGVSPTSRTTPSAMPRSRPCSSCSRATSAGAPTRRSCILRSGRPSSSARQYPRGLRALRAGQRAARASMRRSTSRTSSAARARIRAFFDAAFFAARAGGGDPIAAPIFIVGLPRSGSTLVEQILASHSRVEGTMELPNIITHRARVRRHGREPRRLSGDRRRGPAGRAQRTRRAATSRKRAAARGP